MYFRLFFLFTPSQNLVLFHLNLPDAGATAVPEIRLAISHFKALEIRFRCVVVRFTRENKRVKFIIESFWFFFF